MHEQDGHRDAAYWAAQEAQLMATVQTALAQPESFCDIAVVPGVIHFDGSDLGDLDWRPEEERPAFPGTE